MNSECEPYYISVSKCALCGGHHDEVACPRSYSAGQAVLSNDDRVLGGHIVTQYDSRFIGRVDDHFVVAQPTVSPYLINRVSDAQRDGWMAVAGVAYLDRDVLCVDQPVGFSEAAVSLSASALRDDVVTLRLSEPYSVMANPNVSLVETLMQPCTPCGSFHMTAGVCPSDFTTSLYRTYRDDEVVRMPSDGAFVLDQRASGVALPIDDQAISGVDRAAIHGCGLREQGTVILSSQRWDTGVLVQLGSAFGGGVSVATCPDCGTFHGGVPCPSYLALAPYLVKPGNSLWDVVVPDRFSLSETPIPSWWEPSVPMPYLGMEFGDYLVGRVTDAVYEMIRSHVTVAGDLIVQVNVLVQAETGDISQIGISYN